MPGLFMLGTPYVLALNDWYIIDLPSIEWSLRWVSCLFLGSGRHACLFSDWSHFCHLQTSLEKYLQINVKHLNKPPLRYRWWAYSISVSLVIQKYICFSLVVINISKVITWHYDDSSLWNYVLCYLLLFNIFLCTSMWNAFTPNWTNAPLTVLALASASNFHMKKHSSCLKMFSVPLNYTLKSFSE